jgi:hypothetical protein
MAGDDEEPLLVSAKAKRPFPDRGHALVATVKGEAGPAS